MNKALRPHSFCSTRAACWCVARRDLAPQKDQPNDVVTLKSFFSVSSVGGLLSN